MAECATPPPQLDDRAIWPPLPRPPSRRPRQRESTSNSAARRPCAGSVSPCGPGRCLGLVGRNGAGKSTLVSILSGIYPADRGEVRFDGVPAPALGAVGAWRRQIATVFQHSMVVPGLTVAENVFLGRQPQPGRPGGLAPDARPGRRRSCPSGDFPIDVNLACADLTVEQRQIVEIARALAAGTRCLLLDEPTAALERAGIERLFARVRQLTASGVAILYISHHLEEVFEICQDVAVIRDGELVLTGASRGAVQGPAGLGDGRTGCRREPGRPGRPRGTRRRSPAAPAPEPCLVVDHVSSNAPGGRVTDVSLEVRSRRTCRGHWLAQRRCRYAGPDRRGRCPLRDRPGAGGGHRARPGTP